MAGGTDGQKDGSGKPTLYSLDKKLSAVESTLSDIVKQLEDVNLNKDLFNDIRDSINFFRDNFDAWKTVFSAVDDMKKKQSAIEADNVVLKAELRKVKTELEDITCEKNASFLELHGIPVLQGEELHEIVSTIAKSSNCGIDMKDIQQITRVHTKRQDFCPILVKFASSESRNAFYFAAKKKRLRASDLGLQLSAVSTPVYVNDYLTFQQRALLSKARSVKKDKQWFAVWTKFGRIYVKLHEYDKPIRLLNDWDLEVLCK